jgi:GAF domain-containing protein
MPTDYQSLNKQLAALLADERDALANSANFVGVLFTGIPGINWAGIYVLREQQLVLGPFQGKPACVRIPLGTGVCGTAAEKAETLRVDDVHDFAGHIVCDPESNSEIVVPLVIDGKLVGVLDIDSPQRSRFSAADQLGVELLCDTFLQSLQKGGGEFI